MYFVMSMRCVFIVKIMLKPCKTNPILGILFKSLKICKWYGKFCSKMLEEGWRERRTQKSINVNKFIFWVEGNTITSTQSKKTMTSFVFSKWTVHPHLDHRINFISWWTCAIKEYRKRGPFILTGEDPSWSATINSRPIKCQAIFRCELKPYGYHKEFRVMLFSVMSGTLFSFYGITLARQSMWETTCRMLLVLIMLWVPENGK
jgi:hypothetical protein